MLKLLPLLLLLSLQAPENHKPKVSVTPAGGVVKDGTIHVRCRVPRHASHRKMSYGVPGWTSSTHQLEGEDSRVTYDLFLEHTPCDAVAIACAVEHADGSVERDVQPFRVLGCDVP